ncbi:MAG: hypothetical protein AAF652_14010 [Cyanobacteria bacterium P01_C01_bin.72]
MKINQLKQQVYQLTATKNTKQLKSNRAELTTGKDLRIKTSWVAIYSTLKLISGFQQEQATKEILTEHQFKELNSHSSFQDLLHNVRSLGKFCNSLESKIERLQKTKDHHEQ